MVLIAEKDLAVFGHFDLGETLCFAQNDKIVPAFH